MEHFWLLTALSMLTSLLTATVGAGGGAVLLAVMALLLPVQAVIPIHGLVQLASNSGRTLLSWRHIDWPTIALFAPFSLLGAGLGSMLLVNLPSFWLQISIALFILYLCWGPALPRAVISPPAMALAALATGFISLFVGASGPLVAAFIKARFTQRFTTVATFSMAMVTQHAPKALIFTLAGFAFADWWLLIVSMAVAGIIGTWLGLQLLGRLSDKHFQRWFNLILTLLALRLLWQALFAA
ncbi:sulfite exporter TauE/SafE family protein [Idiomarina xiamenensis]|uniref:Probable membrane transporter protein n=1 Tax=Idiomarina xiamenensis 10-D-4 TaxID=740709 RepID=K2K9L5_9GAMM|nr:permease [Idiomarina xiamenensis 10-D-4]